MALADPKFTDRHIGVKIGTDRRHDLFDPRAGSFDIDNAAAAWFTPENDVLKNGEVVGEHKVLVHHADASIDRIAR